VCGGKIRVSFSFFFHFKELEFILDFSLHSSNKNGKNLCVCGGFIDFRSKFEIFVVVIIIYYYAFKELFIFGTFFFLFLFYLVFFREY
jgi:hypothetical protein